MPNDDNPISIVFDSLWTLLESNTELTDIVRPKNFIKLGTETEPVIKAQVATADLPELILLSDSLAGNLHATSHTTKIVKTFVIGLSVGTLRLPVLYTVQWQVFRCFVTWRQNLGGLTWNAKKFVTGCQVVDVNEGDSDPLKNRGIKGWSSLMRFNLSMEFTTSELILQP